MFSSNQKFIISGDDPYNLKVALKCAINILGTKITGYSIDEELGLILYRYISNTDKNVIEISEKDSYNIDYIFNIVNLYLSSDKYKTLLNKTINKYVNNDGGCYEGWILGSYEELSNKYNSEKVLLIQPYWTFYHK